MSTELAKPKSTVPVIHDPDQLQKWMMGLIENPTFAARYDGIIDRNAMFLAVAYCRNNWWQLSKIKDPSSIVNSVIQAGAYGWTCDGITGHAYIVPFGEKAVLMPGYKGLLDLVRRSGKCEASIEAVHEGDVFEYRGRFSEPLHVRTADPQRRMKPISHAYVVAAFTSGIVKCFCWSREECIAHRDRFSQGWRRVAGKPDKESENPWCERHPGFWVMCCKTVLRNAINRGELPISLKDNAGRQTLTTLPDDEPRDDSATAEPTPLPTFQSPAGFDDPIHTEPQAPYSVGDDIAADADKHVHEQTPIDEPEELTKAKRDIMDCGTEEDVTREYELATRDLEGCGIIFDLTPVRDARLKQLAAMKKRRSQP